MDQIQAEAKAELDRVLPDLWRAIIENTRHDSAFWLGEILLSEITKETGYSGPPRHRTVAHTI